jgi:hypothetical protein
VRNPLLVEAEGLRGEEEETAEEVKTVLDKLLLYLRVVHSIDYYNQVSIFFHFCVFAGMVCSVVDPDLDIQWGLWIRFSGRQK